MITESETSFYTPNLVDVGHPYSTIHCINPLNAKIVAANFSCSAKVVFVKEKRWLCQSTEAPCNALVKALFKRV